MLELASGNFLRPNGHGGYIIRQSDLSSWARCPLQKFYQDRARHNPSAPQPEILSATAYGSVCHYALQVMEKAMHEGRDDALELGINTFVYYWHPDNIEQLDGLSRITTWLPRQTWNGLLERGKTMLQAQHDLLLKDDSHLLALEYQFAVPMEINGRLHTLTGTIDRLAIKRYYRKPYVSCDDNKSGKQIFGLRWNQQGSAYCTATTMPEFWRGWPESGMGELATFPAEVIEDLERMFRSYGYRLHTGSPGSERLASRRFRWINLQEIKFVDGGWRNARDAARLKLAIEGYIRGCEAEAYGVRMDGEVCRFCAFQKTCGGVGLPDLDEGKP